MHRRFKFTVYALVIVAFFLIPLSPQGNVRPYISQSVTSTHESTFPSLPKHLEWHDWPWYIEQIGQWVIDTGSHEMMKYVGSRTQWHVELIPEVFAAIANDANCHNSLEGSSGAITCSLVHAANVLVFIGFAGTPACFNVSSATVGSTSATQLAGASITQSTLPTLEDDVWWAYVTASGTDTVTVNHPICPISMLEVESFTGVLDTGTPFEGTVTNKSNGNSPLAVSATIAAGTTGRRILQFSASINTNTDSGNQTFSVTQGGSQTLINTDNSNTCNTAGAGTAGAAVTLNYQNSSASVALTTTWTAGSGICNPQSDVTTVTAILPLVGTDYNRNLTDSNSASDVVDRIVVAIRQPSDQVTNSDVLNPVKVIVRGISDGPTVSDLLAYARTLLVNLTDSPSATDIIGSIFTGTRTAQDNVVPSDALGSAKVFVRSMTENPTLSDLIVYLRTLQITTSDSTATNDVLMRVFNPVRFPSDQVALSDLLFSVQTLTRAFTDAANMAETLSYLRTLITTITDNAVATETMAQVFTAVRSPSDQAAGSDVVSIVQVLVRNMTDVTIIVSDTLNVILNTIVTISDSTLTMDALTRLVTFTRGLNETSMASDVVSHIFSTTIISTGGGGGATYSLPSFIIIVGAIRLSFPIWFTPRGTATFDLSVPNPSTVQQTMTITYSLVNSEGKTVFSKTFQQSQGKETKTYPLDAPLTGPGQYLFRATATTQSGQSAQEAQQAFNVIPIQWYAGVIVVYGLIILLAIIATMITRRFLGSD